MSRRFTTYTCIHRIRFSFLRVHFGSAGKCSGRYQTRLNCRPPLLGQIHRRVMTRSWSNVSRIFLKFKSRLCPDECGTTRKVRVTRTSFIMPTATEPCSLIWSGAKYLDKLLVDDCDTSTAPPSDTVTSDDGHESDSMHPSETNTHRTHSRNRSQRFSEVNAEATTRAAILEAIAPKYYALSAICALFQ